MCACYTKFHYTPEESCSPTQIQFSLGAMAFGEMLKGWVTVGCESYAELALDVHLYA